MKALWPLVLAGCRLPVEQGLFASITPPASSLVSIFLGSPNIEHIIGVENITCFYNRLGRGNVIGKLWLYYMAKTTDHGYYWSTGPNSAFAMEIAFPSIS